MADAVANGNQGRLQVTAKSTSGQCQFDAAENRGSARVHVGHFEGVGQVLVAKKQGKVEGV